MRRFRGVHERRGTRGGGASGARLSPGRAGGAASATLYGRAQGRAREGQDPVDAESRARSVDVERLATASGAALAAEELARFRVLCAGAATECEQALDPVSCVRGWLERLGARALCSGGRLTRLLIET